MFYNEFEAKMLDFAANQYAGHDIDRAAKVEFAPTSTGEAHFEFDAFGTVCLVRRGSDASAASPEARELFRRAQLLYREISSNLVSQGASLRDHTVLEQLFNDHSLLAPMDLKERQFVYRTRTASVSAELIAQALGGVAPLPILQTVIGGLGEEIRIAISEQREDQRLGHMMIVVNEGLPFPMAVFSLFSVVAGKVERSGDFDCFRAASKDISFSYYQQTWMLVDPDLLKPDSGEEDVAKLANRMLASGEEFQDASETQDTDHPPSESPMGPEIVAKSLPDVAETLDPLTEDDPPEDGAPATGEFAPAADFSSVRWPSKDENAPDYAYLANVDAPESFELTGSAIRKLIDANSYSPATSSGAIAIALRGAQLRAPHEQERQKRIDIEVVRPDHRNFRCVLGFYFPEADELTLFTGSTVPCRKAIHGYANGGDRSNMLPTGMYSYYVWRHKKLRPALRLSSGNESNATLENGAWATVLRTTNDTIFGTKDTFDRSQPYDNVHCSYYLSENASLGAAFSSWGCLTVRGRKTPSDQWAKFQDVLDEIGATARVDLLLATGKEASLAANGDVAPLQALRQGSRGDRVERLQAALGLTQTGFFGSATANRFTGVERRANDAEGLGAIATGIVTPALAARLGWDVFRIS